MEANKHTTTSDSSTSIFLAGAVLFANLESSGLAEYALKAAIGGFIWMSMKLAGDYISVKIKNRNKK